LVLAEPILAVLRSGVFITLFDQDALQLYLRDGVYGFQMAPTPGGEQPSRLHFKVLADYAGLRKGSHVFFFLKRKITYGGQIVGSTNHGAFYLNGPTSHLGRKANAPLVWDESARPKHSANPEPGTFTRRSSRTGEPGRSVSQPYIIRFNDPLGMRGQQIASDDLYFHLGDYPYPLPSNSIQNMGFCLLTPREVELALKHIENSTDHIACESSEDVTLSAIPTSFSPDMVENDPLTAVSEADLEFRFMASVCSLPKIEGVDHNKVTLVRQIPISPFKPSDMDRADIGVFHEPLVEDGTIPNDVLELKNDTAGKADAEQIVRYS
jgi:hypothetical protein